MTSEEWGILLGLVVAVSIPLITWMFKVIRQLAVIAKATGDNCTWMRRLARRLAAMQAKLQRHEERLDEHDVLLGWQNLDQDKKPEKH